MRFNTIVGGIQSIKADHVASAILMCDSKKVAAALGMHIAAQGDRFSDFVARLEVQQSEGWSRCVKCNKILFCALSLH